MNAPAPNTTGCFRAGAAQVDISPADSQFLIGYPNVRRYSTGVHDPILSCALYLTDGHEEVLLIANDLLFVGNDFCAAVRRSIAEQTQIRPEAILISTTHTHSAPKTVNALNTRDDPCVPPADTNYLAHLHDHMVTAGITAKRNATAAEAAWGQADGTGLGTNRHDPSGPSNPDIPVLRVRRADNHRDIALLWVCAMHPTVLHEDSTLISGDFPGLARQHLQQTVVGTDCVILHHTGACGNLSPRHVTRSNTFAEAQRLGEHLATAVADAIHSLPYSDQLCITAQQRLLHELPRRPIPSIHEAEEKRKAALVRLNGLKEAGADRPHVRTAECDVFGAERLVYLAKAAAGGHLAAACEAVLPAEIQAIRIGPRTLVGWPGEFFVEYALALKQALPNAFIITMANGTLQGYIVTKEAAIEGGYEAAGSVFSHETGDLFVSATYALLANGCSRGAAVPSTY